jgi:hypothetical protein
MADEHPTRDRWRHCRAKKSAARYWVSWDQGVFAVLVGTGGGIWNAEVTHTPIVADVFIAIGIVVAAALVSPGIVYLFSWLGAGGHLVRERLANIESLLTSRPVPFTPAPTVVLIPKPGGASIGRDYRGTNLSCRIHATNNSDRPLRFLHAMLQSTGGWGRAPIYGGADQQRPLGDISAGDTALVVCYFNNLEIEPGAPHTDVVELVDQNGVKHPVPITFSAAELPSSDFDETF